MRARGSDLAERLRELFRDCCRSFRKWSVDKSGLRVEAVFLVEGGGLVPFSFRVEHNGEWGVIPCCI